MKKEIKYILFYTLVLSLIGVLMIYSSSYSWSSYKFNDEFHFLKLQILYLIISVICLYISSRINFNIIKKYLNYFILISIILLILVLIPGIGSVINGSRSWFKIGSFSFQPSEISKIILIIYTSKYLAKYQNDLNNIKRSLLPLFIIYLLYFILIMLEPDMGSSMVILISLIILIFSSGVKLSFFVSLFIIGIIGLTGLIIIAPYRIKRIISFINPWSDPLCSGFQIIQSMYAISSGGLLGLGFKNSIESKFYLPEPQTDFIFAIICEEFGIIGDFIIIILFAKLFYNIIKLSIKQNDLFKKYIILGLGILIILQASLNLCVVCGLMPVTGVTLPFISYGGSSLLISFVSIGLIINASK